MASVTAIMSEGSGDCGEGLKGSVKSTELALRRVKQVEVFGAGK